MSSINDKIQKYEVNKEITVRQFKEHLAKKLSIPVEQQQLVLHREYSIDGMKLINCDVNNSTVHPIECTQSTTSSTENVTTFTTATNEYNSASKDNDNFDPIFEKQQVLLRDYYYNFPYIGHVTTAHLAEAEIFTKKLLSELPSGNPEDKITLYHVLNKLIENENQFCLFYDSSKGMQLFDTTMHLADINSEDRPVLLTLKSCFGLRGYKNDLSDMKLIQLLNENLESKIPHPILDDIFERLSNAHAISKNHIIIKHIFRGSINIVYTVSSLDKNYVNQLPDKLKEQFDQFENARIHPLLYRPSFDIGNFDEHGDKCFRTAQQTFELGPSGRTKTYKTPVGWSRFGLKVLDKYGNDRTWLDPFGHPGNWYRAFHGTGRATPADFNCSKARFNGEFAPVDAMASIFENGFHLARVQHHGHGVYCSPDPAFPEKGYVGIVKIPTKQGEKSFKCMLQVAVNPDSVGKRSTSNIWVVPDPQHIRAYGILIKEVRGSTSSHEANQCTMM